MSKEAQEQILIDYINKNYDNFMKKMQKMCSLKNLTFDEDTYQETLLKVLTKVKEDGLKAETEKEVENYLFRAFVLNTYQYHYQCQRRREDLNVDVSWVLDESEDYDVNRDRLMLFLKELVEKNFNSAESTLWKTKYFSPTNITYQELKRICNMKSPRKVITKINNWLHDNVDLEQVKRIKDGLDL